MDYSLFYVNIRKIILRMRIKWTDQPNEKKIYYRSENRKLPNNHTKIRIHHV